MPTRSVRLEFILSDESKIVKHERVPVRSALESLDPDAWRRTVLASTWSDMFIEWHFNLLKRYRTEFVARTGPKCAVCGNPKTTVDYHSLHHLCDKQNLHVVSHVFPGCGSQECKGEWIRWFSINPTVPYRNLQNADGSRNTPANS